MKQKIIYGVIAAVVILGGGYLYLNSGNKATAPETPANQNSATPENNANQSENTNTPSPVSVPSKNTVVLSAQSAGAEVLVDNFYLEQPGFIVIHEAKGTALGAVVGYSGWLNAGPGQDLTFKATLKPGMNYYAELHEDNGDKKFSATTDKSVEKSAVRFTVVK